MIAQTPPMGWNSWDCYGASVTEATVRQNAETMAAHLLPFGWEYVVVDIQWYQPTATTHEYEPFAELSMDGSGRLTPAANRFPSAAEGRGFAPLAAYVHGLGLKFGIHLMRGVPRMAAHRKLPIAGGAFTCADAANPNSICAWNPDMYGLRAETDAARAYLQSIFALYAEWGVDYVKVDDIAREYPHCQREIELISEVCRNCGREIALSLSPGPAPLERAEHLKQYANLWRITDDFWDEWRLLHGMFERAEKWCVHAGPGHWPDADMLPVGALRQDYGAEGWTKFTQPEQRTMMTLWCMIRSPLMIGAELTKLDAFTLGLLTNAAVLEIEKASWCARPLYTTDAESAWLAPRREDGGAYLALFNVSDQPRRVSLALDNAGLAVPVGGLRATELWSGESLSGITRLAAELPPHDAAVWRVF